MRLFTKIASVLLGAVSIPLVAQAATIGGAYYAVQYDFREFSHITTDKPFQVILAGNPFPGMSEADVARQLLPAMQANKPRTPVVFTYDGPGGEPPHPYYRLYLISAPANDLLADSVCATGKVRLKEPTPGKVYLFGIYCRNDQAMSFTTGWTTAQSPSDPAVGDLLKDLFATVFSDSPLARPHGGKRNFP